MERPSIRAVRRLRERAKALVEPSAVVPSAAVLSNRERFENRRVGLLLSGGSALDTTAVGNTIISNSICGNGGLGIDLRSSTRS